MWKYGFASTVGSAHARSSVPGQDFCHALIVNNARGEEVLVAVASDGAGSANQGQIGSKLACDLFVSEVNSYFANGGAMDRFADGFIGTWINKFQQLVTDKSDLDGVKLQDFACTLLAAVVGREHGIYFQIGDGAIVTSLRDEQDKYRCVWWPQQGEYANTTNFLTDTDAAEKIYYELRHNAVDEVALFTDGIQSMVLDYRTKSAHSPFFAPLFAWLRARPGGYSRELSDSLAAYLASEKINARSDDDKTLILATRRNC